MPKLKIDYISDLHLETRPSQVDSIIEAFDLLKNRGQVCVLCGDIYPIKYAEQHPNYNPLNELLKYLHTKYEHVVYAKGNHEFYGLNAISVYDYVQKNHRHVEIQRIEFGGKTTWIYNILDWYALPPRFPEIKITDSRQIGATTEEYILACDYLRYNADASWKDALMHMKYIAGEDANKVVVSHFLPNKKSIAEEYKNSVDNAYFLVDRTKEIKQGGVDVYIHGHTHTAMKYQLDKTRVVCNPYGYPHEGNRLVVKQITV